MNYSCNEAMLGMIPNTWTQTMLTIAAASIGLFFVLWWFMRGEAAHG